MCMILTLFYRFDKEAGRRKQGEFLSYARQDTQGL